MFKSNVGWIFCQIWSRCRLEYNKSDQMLEFKVAQLFHKVAQFVATNVVFKDCNIAQKVAKHLNDFWKKICPQGHSKPKAFQKSPNLVTLNTRQPNLFFFGGRHSWNACKSTIPIGFIRNGRTHHRLEPGTNIIKRFCSTYVPIWKLHELLYNCHGAPYTLYKFEPKNLHHNDNFAMQIWQSTSMEVTWVPP